jgi:hypothetical protein
MGPRGGAGLQACGKADREIGFSRCGTGSDSPRKERCVADSAVQNPDATVDNSKNTFPNSGMLCTAQRDFLTQQLYRSSAGIYIESIQ